MRSRVRLLLPLWAAVWWSWSGQASAQPPDDDAPAGAAEAEPDVPDPPEPVELRPATVRFRANVEGMAVHYLPDPVLDDDGTGGVRIRLAEPHRYSLLCDAPCDRELPQTHLGLAVARGGTMIRFPEPFGVDGPTGVRVTWRDQSGERLGGTLTLAIGIPLALVTALIPLGVEAAQGEPGAAAIGGGIAGGILLGVTLGVGIAFVLSPDGAEFEVVPLPSDRPGVYSDEWR